jgi:hypothetical protein
MAKGNEKIGLNTCLKTLLITFMLSMLLMTLTSPALAVGEPIARLTDFSGTVMIKSQGAWGTRPVIGLMLYSQDRLVTRGGSKATVTFNDGAVMAVSSNSNLMI